MAKPQEHIEEVKEEVKEGAEATSETISDKAEAAKESIEEKVDKGVKALAPITDKVRELVLGFGEIILTVTVIIGLVSAVISGLSDMGNVGFFTGLGNMFQSISSVIMGALVIFLLFAIKKNTDK